MPCCPGAKMSCWECGEGGIGVLKMGTEPDSLLPGMGVRSGLEYGSESTIRLWGIRW